MASPLKNPIKVGPFYFKFVEANLNPGSEDGFHYGLTQFHEGTCLIHSNMDKSLKRETAFHEFLHVVFFVTGLSERLTEEEEERLIQTISPMTVAGMQDNPEFIDYVLDRDDV